MKASARLDQDTVAAAKAPFHLILIGVAALLVGCGIPVPAISKATAPPKALSTAGVAAKLEAQFVNDVGAYGAAETKVIGELSRDPGGVGIATRTAQTAPLVTAGGTFVRDLVGMENELTKYHSGPLSIIREDLVAEEGGVALENFELQLWSRATSASEYSSIDSATALAIKVQNTALAKLQAAFATAATAVG